MAAFTSFLRISPSDPVDVTRITLPYLIIANIGPVVRMVAGVRASTYVCLVNGPAGSNGNWPAGGGVPTTLSFAHMMASFDNGLTWAEQDAGSGNLPQLPPRNGTVPTTTAGWATVQVVYDETSEIIYVCYPHWDYVNYDQAQPYRLVIARFSVSSDTWLASLTTYGEANAPIMELVQSPWGQQQPYGFVRRPSDGHFIVFYNRYENVPGSPRPGNDYDHCYVSEYTPGVGWAATQKFAGAALEANDYNPYGAVLGESERSHCFMFQYDPPDGFGPHAYKIFSRSVSSAGAFDTLAAVVDSTPDLGAGGRELPVMTPRIREIGTDVQIILSMVINPAGPLPTLWRSYLGNSQVSLVAGDFTLEQVSDLDDFWGAFSLSSGGFGVDGNNVLRAFSWGENPVTGDHPFFNQWVFTSWGAPTTLFTDLTDLSAALNVGNHNGVLSIFSGIGPSGFVFYDEVFYWEIVVAGAAAQGIGGSGIGGGQCFPTNSSDDCLHRLSLQATGLFRELNCRPAERTFFGMPANGRRFQEIGTLALPADDGTDNLVLEARVPSGYDGVLMTRSHQYTGTGFMEGNGDLTWRLQNNFQWFRDAGAVTITQGRLNQPYDLEGGGYRVYSNQVLRYFVNVAVGAAARLNGGRIICALSGWFYPVKGERYNARIPISRRRAFGRGL